MTLEEVMKELESMGNPNTKKVLMKHGAKEPFFGVKVGDLKKIQKKIKKDHDLSKALFKTGNGDAMYLAGLIADKDQITKDDLEEWVQGCNYYMLSEYTVPWIAADAGKGMELALEWIKSDEEKVASAGWATLSSVLSITPEEDLDIDLHKTLIKQVRKDISTSANRVRYTMNGYVIAAGCFSAKLNSEAKKAATAIGKVDVEMGGTACKVPLAADYIAKVENMGRLGKIKKMARC